MTDTITPNTTIAPLTTSEVQKLADCEQTIERGRQSFIEVGNALMKIRDARLYRVTHETFEKYLKARWNFGRAYASRLIGAAETVEMLPIGNREPKPTCEAQVRLLLQFPLEHRAEVWADVLKRVCHDDDGRPEITAKQVEREVKLNLRASDKAPYKARRAELRRVNRERRQQRRERAQRATECEDTDKFDVSPEEVEWASDLERSINSWHAQHQDVSTLELAGALEYYAKTLRGVQRCEPAVVQQQLEKPAEETTL